MSYRKTWGQVKEYIGRPIGLGSGSRDLLPMYNRAAEALWNAGDWVGKFQIYKFKVSGDCHGNQYITFPFQVETVEAMQICNQMLGIRNQAFEFIENATGDLTQKTKGWLTTGLVGDRSEVCTFLDINRGSKKVKAYNSLPTDNGKQIIIMGYDDNNNWIRTLVGGSYVDGEYLTLNAGTPPTTTNFFSQITGVQFSSTPRDGYVYITEVDTLNGNTERTIATYDYDIEIPVFRRVVITGLGTDSCDCVTALCRMRFVPVRSDRDYLQIGNTEAIESYLIYLQKRDNGLFQEAEGFRAEAIRALNDELNQYKGIAPKKMASFANRHLWGASNNVM